MHRRGPRDIALIMSRARGERAGVTSARDTFFSERAQRSPGFTAGKAMDT